MKVKIKKFSDDLEKKTLVVSAFPGCGKSHMFRNNEGKLIMDSDSSKFDKSDFPRNYIKHIKSNIGKADIIMVSSHKEVRDALVDNEIEFTLVYPKRDIKLEYIQRYKNRGNDSSFIKLLESKWNEWMDELEQQSNCKKIELEKGQYLSDVI